MHKVKIITYHHFTHTNESGRLAYSQELGVNRPFQKHLLYQTLGFSLSNPIQLQEARGQFWGCSEVGHTLQGHLHLIMTANIAAMSRNPLLISPTFILLIGIIFHPPFSTGSSMGVRNLNRPCSCRETVSSSNTTSSLGPGRIPALLSQNSCNL